MFSAKLSKFMYLGREDSSRRMLETARLMVDRKREGWGEEHVLNTLLLLARFQNVA